MFHKVLLFLMSLIVFCLMGIGYELQQNRKMSETYLIQQNIVLTNRMDNQLRAINGMNDRLRAQSSYEEELSDAIDKLNGKTPQQFKRRKHI